jgi:hypothetical protein
MNKAPNMEHPTHLHSITVRLERNADVQAETQESRSGATLLCRMFPQ